MKKKIIYTTIPIITSLLFIGGCNQENKNTKQIQDLKIIEKDIVLDNTSQDIEFKSDYFIMNNTYFGDGIGITDKLESNKELIRNEDDIQYFIENILSVELKNINEARIFLIEDIKEYYTLIGQDKENYDLKKVKEFEKRNVEIYNRIYQLFQLSTVAKEKTRNDKTDFFLEESMILLDTYTLNQVRLISLNIILNYYLIDDIQKDEYVSEVNNLNNAIDETLEEDIVNYNIFKRYMKEKSYK